MLKLTCDSSTGSLERRNGCSMQLTDASSINLASLLTSTVFGWKTSLNFVENWGGFPGWRLVPKCTSHISTASKVYDNRLLCYVKRRQWVLARWSCHFPPHIPIFFRLLIAGSRLTYKLQDRFVFWIGWWCF